MATGQAPEHDRPYADVEAGSTTAGVLGGLLARKLMRTVYRAIRSDTDPVTPFDPTNPRFSWTDAMLWAATAGIALGIAKMISARLAALGWKAATGTLPPGDARGATRRLISRRVAVGRGAGSPCARRDDRPVGELEIRRRVRVSSGRAVVRRRAWRRGTALNREAGVGR